MTKYFLAKFPSKLIAGAIIRGNTVFTYNTSLWVYLRSSVSLMIGMIASITNPM